MKIETKIAKDFCQTVNWWLSAEELAEVVRLNAAETNPGVCHTHDFFDANEAMAAAFENFNLDVFDAPELCNTAWDLAKSVGFDGSKL